jgi:hypothetical protein
LRKGGGSAAASATDPAMLVTVFHCGHGSRLDKYQLNVADFVLMRMFRLGTIIRRSSRHRIWRSAPQAFYEAQKQKS